jgi:hypothetical protein
MGWNYLNLWLRNAEAMIVCGKMKMELMSRLGT